MTGWKLQTCEEPEANVNFDERKLFSMKQKSPWYSSESKGKAESIFFGY